MSAARRMATIPDLAIRMTDFGPSVFGKPPAARLAAGASALKASVRFAGLVRYAKRERIDIVHGTEKPRDAIAGVLLARAAGIKSVIHMHVGYDDWLSPRARWALGAADAIVGVSRFVSRSLVRAGYREDRIHSVHNSLDLSEPIWTRSADRVAVRRALGVPIDAPMICIASRLFRWKGHDDLVEALSSIQRELPDVRLIIVGEDDPRANPGGGSYRQELVEMIRQRGLERNVVFTGFRTDVPDLMSASDVFCQPSAEEPFGMVYLEAMAARTPVVAYSSGGAPEVVDHGETGLLVDRGDIPALAAALLRLLSDGDLRRRFGEAGRRVVETKFTPERSAAAMLDVYRTVAAGGRVAAGSYVRES